jgi:phospholipid transport system substrate-binding protein
MKKLAFSVFLVWCLLAAPLAAFAAAQGAEEVVKTTTDQVIARLKADRPLLKKEPGRIYGLVEELIVPHFDFWKISQWVLGKNWRTATEAQKTEFTNQFKVLLVRTYATALLEYSDEPIRYLPPVQEKEDSVIIKQEVDRNGSNNVPIHYRMHQKDGDWKVYDVAVDNVSLIATYRGSFADEIQRTGLDRLISGLSQRNIQRAGSGAK